MQHGRECSEFEALLNRFLDEGESLAKVVEYTSHPVICSDCYELLVDYQQVFQGDPPLILAHRSAVSGNAPSGSLQVAAKADLCHTSQQSDVSTTLTQQLWQPAAESSFQSKRKLVWSVGPSIVAMMLILIGMSFDDPWQTGRFEDSILAKGSVLENQSRLLATAIQEGPSQLSNQVSPGVNNDAEFSSQFSLFPMSLFAQEEMTLVALADRKKLLVMTGTHPFFIDLLEGERFAYNQLEQQVLARYYPSLSVSERLLLLPSLSSSLIVTLNWLHQSLTRGLARPAAIDSGWELGFCQANIRQV